jgi:hypothetical protein
VRHYLAGNLLLLPTLAALVGQLPLRRNNNRSGRPPIDSSAPLLVPGFGDPRLLHSGTFGAQRGGWTDPDTSQTAAMNPGDRPLLTGGFVHGHRRNAGSVGGGPA